MIRLLRHALTVLFICGITLLSQAQPQNASFGDPKPAKPYKVLTTGKQVTIKSSKDIKSLMVWTSDGNRIVEQRDINSSNYTFRVSTNEKIFFIMVKLEDGKVYSEKIGIQ